MGSNPAHQLFLFSNPKIFQERFKVKINKCSKNELTKVLSSRKEMIVNVIKNDELEVTDELIVYQAVRNWIRHDVKNRAKVILYLFWK